MTVACTTISYVINIGFPVHNCDMLSSSFHGRRMSKKSLAVAWLERRR
jgi:hypothetical protein